MPWTVRTPWMPSASAPLRVELVIRARRKAARARGIQMIRTTTRIGTTESVSSAEPPVEHQKHDRDADQQHEVADREHRGLEELLQGVDVALQARHQPADLGLVHERQRDPLQMGEHRATQIDQQALGDARDQRLLHEIGDEVDADDGEEDQRAQRQQPLGRRRPIARPDQGVSITRRRISGIVIWLPENTSTASTASTRRRR